MRFPVSLITLVLMMPASIMAAPAECDRLSGSQADIAKSVIASEFMYDCCDNTIGKCMAVDNPCAGLASRVAKHVCGMAASGAARDSIVRSLEKRAMSVTGPKVLPVAASLPKGALFGDSGAPVEIVMFTCARCPFCSKLVPAVYREVESGRLKGVARLVLKPFPIKSHPNSSEANQALATAIELGMGWAYLLELYRRFDSFKASDLAQMAAAAGIDRAAFEAAMQAGTSRPALVESKKEGLKFGVDSTPTLFVAGRRYQSELDVETVVDVVVEIAGPRLHSGSLK